MVQDLSKCKSTQLLIKAVRGKIFWYLIYAFVHYFFSAAVSCYPHLIIIFKCLVELDKPILGSVHKCVICCLSLSDAIYRDRKLEICKTRRVLVEINGEKLLFCFVSYVSPNDSLFAFTRPFDPCVPRIVRTPTCSIM